MKRVVVEYDQPYVGAAQQQLPTTMVAKFATGDLATRILARSAACPQTFCRHPLSSPLPPHYF